MKTARANLLYRARLTFAQSFFALKSIQSEMAAQHLLADNSLVGGRFGRKELFDGSAQLRDLYFKAINALIQP